MKSGDDCRQEHLAVQLISHFYGRHSFQVHMFCFWSSFCPLPTIENSLKLDLFDIFVSLVSLSYGSTCNQKQNAV